MNTSQSEVVLSDSAQRYLMQHCATPLPHGFLVHTMRNGEVVPLHSYKLFDGTIVHECGVTDEGECVFAELCDESMNNIPEGRW